MIKLFDDWVIVVGPFDYALAKYLGTYVKSGRTKETFGFRYIGYYSSVAGCLKRLGEELTREALKDGWHTLGEAVQTIK